jgi:uncharacterized protein (TIGR02118 family)
MIRLQAFYPNTKDGFLDHDYYVNKHAPFAKELLGPLGMINMEVSKGTETMDGGEPPYTCVVTVTFESREAMDEGFSGERKDKLLADIPNFTDVEPIIQVGEVLL